MNQKMYVQSEPPPKTAGETTAAQHIQTNYEKKHKQQHLTRKRNH